MFAIPFPMNAKPAGGGFTVIGNLTLASAPSAGHAAYSPVNGYLYLHYASTVVVCDLTGTPSVVTLISMTSTVTSIAYLPNSDKVFALQASHKYQLIDCTNNTAATQVTMTSQLSGAPSICSSFSVDQSDDSVYLGAIYQLGKLNPSTGAISSKSVFDSPDPGWGASISSQADIAFNNNDGYVYVATPNANHMLLVIDPAQWTGAGGLVTDFGATPTNISVGSSKLVINRTSDHVYINANAAAPNKLFVMTDASTLTTITPTADAVQGDYDTVFQQVASPEVGTPGFVSVYDTTDTLITRTSIGGALAANPVALYCAPLQGRYAIQKSASPEVLQVIARS